MDTSGTRVLVTGGEGFLGCAVAEHLSALGYRVSAPGRRTLDVTKTITLRADFDHVVHTAARVGVAESWSQPAEFVAVNAAGTANVLEYSRKHGCSVTMLSAYVYGAFAFGPVSEGTPAEPGNPYALSKRLAELVCEFFSRAHGMSITVLRLFNVYGPGQNRHFLIPTILEQLLDPSVAVIEVDDLRPRRDYVYVSDVASAVAATLAGRGFAVFNVGGGASHSVADVIEAAMKASGIRKRYRDRGVERRNEIQDVVADASALRQASGWTPAVTLDAGLAATIGAMRTQ